MEKRKPFNVGQLVVRVAKPTHGPGGEGMSVNTPYEIIWIDPECGLMVLKNYLMLVHPNDVDLAPVKTGDAIDLARFRGKIEQTIIREDSHPMVVGTLIAGIVTGLRESAKNPPKDDKGSTEWKQDSVVLGFATALDNLKMVYRRKLEDCWRNRAGLDR